MKRRPKKPTKPFGTINFSKSGTVSRRIEVLSDDKDTQQLQVAQRFSDGLRDSYRFDVGQPSPVSDNFPDVELVVQGTRVDVEITEISQEQDFQLPPEPLTPRQAEMLAKHNIDPKHLGVRFDEQKRLTSIWRAIAAKLERHYAPTTTRPLWLLVFTTSPAIHTLYFEAGTLRVGEPLQFAREVLARRGSQPFHEVWFTNLLTRPVRVWPLGADLR